MVKECTFRLTVPACTVQSEQWTGDKYTGEWKQNIRHGVGELQKVSGENYDGQWEDDEKHGKGWLRM